MTDAALAAERVVRALASATNGFLAGLRIVVPGDGDVADGVRRILGGLGARVVATPGRGTAAPVPADCDVVVVTEAWNGVGAPLVVDALPGAAARWSDGTPVRPGVRRRGDGVLGVPVDVHAPPLTGAGAPGRRGDAEGRMRWAAERMPVTRALAAELAERGLLAGRRVLVSLVLEPKTSVLARALRDAGADPVLFANCAETDGEVAAVLRRSGFVVHAAEGPVVAAERAAIDRRNALAALDTEPDLLIDDGAQLLRLAHLERPGVLAGLLAAEETTSGVRAAAAMGDQLRVPVVAVNDASTKTGVDNRHGTGHSCVLAVADLLDRARPRARGQCGTRWSVYGFGPVGEGTAEAARALGAVVTVVEPDPLRAMAALHRGFDVGDAVPAADADVLISASGRRATLGRDILDAAPDAAVIAVAGGVDGEVAFGELADAGYRRLDCAAAGGPDVAAVEGIGLLRAPDGRTLLLLADGDGVNYAAGEGNAVEVMDLSLASQLAALRQLLGGPAIPPG
ncbi:adenosylhomocysteinase, partial [Mycetocola reblochoni]